MLGDGTSISRATPGKISFNKNVTYFDYKYFNSFFQTPEGEFYAFGSNIDGELGMETISTSQKTPILHPLFSNVSKISMGSEFNLLLFRNSWFSFGKNDNFQLGQEIIPLLSSNEINATISGGAEFTMYLNATGNLYSNGYNTVNFDSCNFPEKTIGGWIFKFSSDS
jgi:hypothetical protein